MSRKYNTTSIAILKFLLDLKAAASLEEIKSACGSKLSAKDFYNYLFRLIQQELVEKSGNGYKITDEGKKIFGRLSPEKDGVWKMVIFDIPEKHKKVRAVLRAKLRQLHFQKWQNSIWISPYALDAEIEDELNALGEKFFVRLIKTTEINHKKDLDSLFRCA